MTIIGYFFGDIQNVNQIPKLFRGQSTIYYLLQKSAKVKNQKLFNNIIECYKSSYVNSVKNICKYKSKSGLNLTLFTYIVTELMDKFLNETLKFIDTFENNIQIRDYTLDINNIKESILYKALKTNNINILNKIKPVIVNTSLQENDIIIWVHYCILFKHEDYAKHFIKIARRHIYLLRTVILCGSSLLAEFILHNYKIPFNDKIIPSFTADYEMLYKNYSNCLVNALLNNMENIFSELLVRYCNEQIAFKQSFYYSLYEKAYSLNKKKFMKLLLDKLTFPKYILVEAKVLLKKCKPIISNTSIDINKIDPKIHLIKSTSVSITYDNPQIKYFCTTFSDLTD
jgi:hypothetical protein